jgi:hypothetical protein
MDANALAAQYLDDPASTWSVGSYGALAEFARDADEPCERRDLQCLTARGAIRIRASGALQARAYEVPSVGPAGWHHGVVFVLPAAGAAMAARTVLTELGPDRDAVRAGDREAVLFDLGLGASSFDFCVRTAEPALLGALRAAAGRPLLGPGRAIAATLVEASPHRVAISRAARIEVYQRIPPAGSASPAGPHTHLMPRLLRPSRNVSANVPIPAHTLPQLTLYPPHPAKDHAGVPKPFAREVHEAFQRVLQQFGDDRAVAAKRTLVAAIAANRAPESWAAPRERHPRQACRIALRQLRLLAGDAALDAWDALLERRGG